MKVSEAWLRDRVDLSGIGRDRLLEALTAAGLEVEAAEPVAPPLPGLVVARIVACAPHPNAGKLQVCQVECGESAPLQIVCGAPNARPGLVAPLARVGASMPGGLQISAASLRGVESFGMLCSASELDLDSDASGLWELPSELVPGTALAEALQLDDVAIEIKLTPNRSDCLGVRGLARELSAIFQRPLRERRLASITVAANERLPIRLEAGADCPRYLGRAVVGLDPAACTPLWLRERLRRSGLRAIHPLVDITNYVLLETGQPLHAFDLDKLVGGLTVRRAREGEALELLDGRTVQLDSQFLAIADDEGVVALAGVMGGARSKVGADTRRVFFESAHFAPAAIMGRARRLGLATDAAHRFERGVDPDAPGYALELATELCLQIMGGVAGPVCGAERSADLPHPQLVQLRAARLEKVLGIAVAGATVEALFTRLGCVVETAADGWSVRPPSARFDLAIEEDLIEEVARLVGYEQIPALSPVGSLVARSSPEARREPAELRRRLVLRDFREAITFAFVARADLARFDASDQAFGLANPLSADLEVMRTSLLPGLSTALLHNLRRQQERVRLFELGRVFLDRGRSERQRLAAVVAGGAEREQWGMAARKVEFHDLAGDLEALVGPRHRLRLRPAAVHWAHPGRCAEVLVDELAAGFIGEFHPRLVAELDAPTALLGFELDLEAISGWVVPVSSALSRFPSVRRDLAFVLPEQVSFDAVSRSLQDVAGAALAQVELFDVYRGPTLPNASRSLAIGLIFQDHSRTLIDTEVDRLIALCIDRVQAAFGGSIRR